MMTKAEQHLTMRLQRFLARSGQASRRRSEVLIASGHVSVNGTVVTELGTKVDPACDIVAVDGIRCQLADVATYLVLNKPSGFVTTMSDPQGRPCVAELVPIHDIPGLFSVGRLDKDTTGLLLFTNDGDFAHALLHPARHVPKRYLACVEGVVTDDELEPLRRGITLDDGACAPAKTCRYEMQPSYHVPPALTPTSLQSLVEISIHEGRKRQVKRMFAAIHHPVVALHRISFGTLELADLKEGHYRHLTSQEVVDLQHASAVASSDTSLKGDRS